MWVMVCDDIRLASHFSLAYAFNVLICQNLLWLVWAAFGAPTQQYYIGRRRHKKNCAKCFIYRLIPL